MSEQQTSTPEAETPAPTNNNNNTSRNTNNNNRRRPNNRNNNLASMANAERNFKGKIEELPIIGKPYEQTDTYEKLIDATVDYSIINLDEGDDITKLLEKGEGDFLKSSGMTEPTITTAEEALKSKVYVYQKKMDIYMRREHLFEQNKKRVFTIMLGQCTPSLLTSVKSSDNWTAKNEEKDPIWLMGQLKKLTVGIDDFQNDLVTAHDALTRVYRMYQRPLKTNDQYMERYKEYWATCASAAGENCLVPEITKTGKYSSMNDEKWNEATKAMYFFLHADKICFGDKIREIQENVVLGTDSFPTTLDAAYRILSDTQSRLNQDRVRCGGGYDRRITGYSNYQGRGNRENQPTIPEGANIVIGTDRQVYTIQCNRCNEWGHYADKCPEAPDQEVSNKKFTFKCKNHGKCNNYSSVLQYLLDTGSTHNTVKDKEDITNLTNLFKKRSFTYAIIYR